MATITITAMLIAMSDADLLTLTHWLSPVFPVGGYAYSQALETAIADGDVKDSASLADWLRFTLTDGSGQADAILLTSAMAPDADLAGLNFWAAALAPSAERWQETSEQGAAFTRAVNDLRGESATAAALPIAVGRAARGLDLATHRVAALYLQSMIATLVTGAVRHIPLGQAAGQKIIAALQPTILAVAEDAPGKSPIDIRSATFGADRASMIHETQETRIFRT
ncbi:urease accessory protein UreF [Boseongicola aestuarii]|uniref:Urease accessory protein UreF n=1 Tax=Boseongicola aestuarii TaxID=1470561 RepID=A0A238J0Y3_9RHOB|nr:urease accessory UreF family protein [Boseongicola aestuarii]SMX24389.1 Urease accessory protein UreF [Boseongicola aestuarii]